MVVCLVFDGNVDFYPNDEKQLSCVVDPGGVCSHTHRFFAESINSQDTMGEATIASSDLRWVYTTTHTVIIIHLLTYPL